jgi:para-aminobenzoate synthetase component 2
LAVERDTIPAPFEITGSTSGGVVMAMRHREQAVEGVQFHPESVLTEGGHRTLANWLVVCGDGEAVERSAGLAPIVSRGPGSLVPG